MGLGHHVQETGAISDNAKIILLVVAGFALIIAQVFIATNSLAEALALLAAMAIGVAFLFAFMEYIWWPFCLWLVRRNR